MHHRVLLASAYTRKQIHIVWGSRDHSGSLGKGISTWWMSCSVHVTGCALRQCTSATKEIPQSTWMHLLDCPVNYPCNALILQWTVSCGILLWDIPTTTKMLDEDWGYVCSYGILYSVCYVRQDGGSGCMATLMTSTPTLLLMLFVWLLLCDVVILCTLYIVLFGGYCCTTA